MRITLTPSKVFTPFLIVSAALCGLALHYQQVEAQISRENPGLEEGYDNDQYDQQGCIWRDDITIDGINVEEEEVEVPDVFFIDRDTPTRSCYTEEQLLNSDPEFYPLEEYGEAALWPFGCYNVVNQYVPGPFGLAQWIDLYGSFETNTNYDSWDEFYYAVAGTANKRKDPPDIDIMFSNSSPARNSNLRVTAIPKRYRSTLQQIMYGWAMKRPNGNFISQQGLVAGGEEITETRDFVVDGQEVNSDVCKRVTRTPEVDADSDGMDDNWERRYGLDPSDPSDAVSDLPPVGDNDGIDLSDISVFGVEDNPLLPGFDPYLNIRVTPDTTASSPPGDGRFTNEEEYIAGTNPLDPDSDDDGFLDGADFVGFGQQWFDHFVDIDQREGADDRLTYRVTTVGVSDFIDEENTGRTKVLIDSDEKTVIAGVDSDLKASLVAEAVAPVNSVVDGISQVSENNEVIVDADAFQSEADRAALEYRWFVEFRNFQDSELSARVQVPPDPLSTVDDQVGRRYFRYPVNQLAELAPEGFSFSPEPGSMLYVTAEISNLVTHEFASKRIPVSIGSDRSLQVNIRNLDDPNAPFETAEEYAFRTCTEIRETEGEAALPYFCQVAGISLNELLPWLVFEGSEVEVVANPTQTSADNLVYVWWVNNRRVEEGFGAESLDNKLIFQPNSQDRVYNVKVRAYQDDINRAIAFESQIDLQVIGPTALVTIDPLEPVAGETVQFVGELLNFPESFVGGYEWEINEPDGTLVTSSSRAFSYSPPSPGGYSVKLILNFQTGTGDPRVLEQERYFVVAESPALTTRAGQMFASLRETISSNALGFYKYALGLFVVIIVVFYSLGYTRRRKGGENEK